MFRPTIVIPICLCLAAAACGTGGGNDDGGLPDADGTDGGGDEAQEPFELIFEPGAAACAQFMIQRSAEQELALRGRITFLPGTISLERDMQDEEMNLVDEVYLTGPHPVQAQADGPGQMSHSFEEQVWGHLHLYTYTQSFHAGARPFTIEAGFSFRFRNGVADPDTLTFDADRVGEDARGYDVDYRRVSLLGFLDEGQDYLTEKQTYRSCSFADLDEFRIEVGLAGGDTIILSKRYLKPLMGTGPASITRAEVDIDGQQRTVDDYFHLAYGADMHNFGERYLVFLDDPVGDVHAIRFAESDIDDPPTVVDLLGENMELLEQRDVAAYDEEEVP